RCRIGRRAFGAGTGHRRPALPHQLRGRARGPALRSGHMKTTVPALVLALAATPLLAHEGRTHSGGISVDASEAVRADFDIVHAKISTRGNIATFHMAVSGKAGQSRPAATGQLAGS